MKQGGLHRSTVRLWKSLLLALFIIQVTAIQQNYGHYAQLTPWNANHAFVSFAQKPAKTAMHKKDDTNKLIAPIAIHISEARPPSDLELLEQARIARSPQKRAAELSLLSPIRSTPTHTPRTAQDPSSLVAPLPLPHQSGSATASSPFTPVHLPRGSTVSPVLSAGSTPTASPPRDTTLAPVHLQHTHAGDPLQALYHRRLTRRRSRPALPDEGRDEDRGEKGRGRRAVGGYDRQSQDGGGEELLLLRPEVPAGDRPGPHRGEGPSADQAVLVTPLSLDRPTLGTKERADEVFQPLKLEREREEKGAGELIPVRPGVAQPPAEDLVTPVKLEHSITHDGNLLEPERLGPASPKNQDLSLVQPVPLKSDPKLDNDVFAPIKLEADARPSDLLSAVRIHGEPADSLDWSLFSPTVIPRGLDSGTVGILKHQLKAGTQVLTNSPNPTQTKPKLSAVEQYLLSIRGGGKLGSRELFARGGHLFFPSRLRRYLKQLVGSTDPKRLRKKPYHRKHPTEDLVLKYAGRPKYEMARLSRYIDSKRRKQLRKKLISSRRKEQSERLLRTQRIIESKNKPTPSAASLKRSVGKQSKNNSKTPSKNVKKKTNPQNSQKSPSKGKFKAAGKPNQKGPHPKQQKISPKLKAKPQSKTKAKNPSKPTTKPKYPPNKPLSHPKKPQQPQDSKKKSLARTPPPNATPAPPVQPKQQNTSFWSKLWPFSTSSSTTTSSTSTSTNSTLTQTKVSKVVEQEDDETDDPRERMVRRIRQAVRVEHQHLREELTEFEHRSREPVKSPDIWALSI